MGTQIAIICGDDDDVWFNYIKLGVNNLVSPVGEISESFEVIWTDLENPPLCSRSSPTHPVSDPPRKFQKVSTGANIDIHIMNVKIHNMVPIWIKEHQRHHQHHLTLNHQRAKFRKDSLKNNIPESKEKWKIYIIRGFQGRTQKNVDDQIVYI